MTVFAKILDGDIASYKVYEDDIAYAFLDISQITTGHTLVIPKKASISLLETDDEIAAYIFKIATQLAKKIVQNLGASGCNILTNAHAVAGQEVMHFHVHIIPRYDENDGLAIKFISSNPTSENLSTILEKINK
jgi:Diadenosine tetraphosphate (Ap4A) hydrolase and other HIT family hydrolases